MTIQHSNDLDTVLRRTGATYRQLDHWCTRKYIRPGNPGTGTSREWPESEIKVAQLMVRMTAAGIPPRLAVRIARAGGNLEIGPGITVVVQ
jgi:hypothetical protein